MIDLLPCPFCGEKLVQHDDHHGTWWAHKNEVGDCWASVEQIHGDDDGRRWNRRHAQRAPTPDLTKALTEFSDFINEPPQYEDKRMVRDYRHELARKWVPLLEQLLALTSTERLPTERKFTGPGHLEQTGYTDPTPKKLCSCKASARDGQHMMWCSAISSTES